MMWQRRLFREFIDNRLPSALDLPTGLGKTSVMTIWMIARARGAPLPRRLVYVVDRRAVVDQATAEAEKLRNGIEQIPELKAALRLRDRPLPISTLRGQFIDNREWLANPGVPAIIVGTVDMVGSRLLFSGYGVSRKMRPYHAGLLGADALVVLDEAHLVPPFAHLLCAVETDGSLRPMDENDRKLVPRLAFLPLSATQRERQAENCEAKAGAPPQRNGAPFRLEEEDVADPTVGQRLRARKRLRLYPLAPRDPDRQLAETAWQLATKGGKFSRVVVFCDRREKADEGGGPSALGVKAEIEKLAQADRRAGRAKRDLHEPLLLVGGRRVRERDAVAKRLRELGLIGEKMPLDKPAFLVATAAGEVGVDIDADHMVADVVAWERMVQRLGRVNRRGEGDAEIAVFWNEPAVKNAAAPTEAERRLLTALTAKAVLETLPPVDDAGDASPGALRALAQDAQADPALKQLIAAATTPEPLRPALDRALAEAWSLTSLVEHTGRPEVAPWLRGWVDEAPQTTIVWRRHLPIRTDADGRVRRDVSGRPVLPKAEIEEFFEAAPPHESERLETETFRLPDWLFARAQAALKPAQPTSTEAAADESDAGEAPAPGAAVADAPAEETTAAAAKPLRRDDVAALLLSGGGECARGYTLGELAEPRKGRDRDEFQQELAGKIMVVDARFGGLQDGLLKADHSGEPPVLDADADWERQAGFRVRRQKRDGASGDRQDQEWRIEERFVVRRDGEGEAMEWLVVDHFKDAAQKEDARSVANPQSLAEHQSWTRRVMRDIARRSGLFGIAVEALCIAAGLHDEGKKTWRWQHAFKAPRDAKELGLPMPLAKTKGPIDHALLDGYRHEFGSLRYVGKNPEFQALPEEWRELVLHVVAAHHGFARPVIGTQGCDDEAIAVIKQRARDAALRFARLQKRWGPWGLAWWEALLRAADAQASRENDERAPEKVGAKPAEVA